MLEMIEGVSLFTSEGGSFDAKTAEVPECGIAENLFEGRGPSSPQ